MECCSAYPFRLLFAAYEVNFSVFITFNTCTTILGIEAFDTGLRQLYFKIINWNFP